MNLPDDDELSGGVTEALRAGDLERALSLLVRAMAEDPMVGEIAVRAPGGREILGYLIPASARASLRTAEGQSALANDAHDPDATLAGLLERSADSPA